MKVCVGISQKEREKFVGIHKKKIFTNIKTYQRFNRIQKNTGGQAHRTFPNLFLYVTSALFSSNQPATETLLS